MKKYLLLAIIAIMVLAAPAFASPFLICDEDASVTAYLVTMDSETEIEVAAPLHYDMEGIEVGKHNIEVKAKNIWGISSPTPFSFIKALPVISGIGLSEE